jgi:hypothetical protein
VAKPLLLSLLYFFCEANACPPAGVREEEAVEPDAGDQGTEARPQHLRRPDRRPPHPRRQGARAARRLVPRVVQG